MLVPEAVFHMIQTPEEMQKAQTYHYLRQAFHGCKAAHEHEMKLHGASVLWAKIKRAETILEEALALENQPC